jgi:hypothetical protein
MLVPISLDELHMLNSIAGMEYVKLKRITCSGNLCDSSDKAMFLTEGLCPSFLQHTGSGRQK